MAETFRKEDLELILSGAAALQTREATKLSLDELKGITENGEERYPLSAVYGVAEDLMIPREYVDEYIQTRFPSKERQLQTLREIGGVPTTKSIIEFHLSEFVNCMTSRFPGEFFDVRAFENSGYIKKIKTRGFFRKEIVERVASIQHNDYHSIINLVISNPSFSEACKDKIAELRDKYSKYVKVYKISYDYPVI